MYKYSSINPASIKLAVYLYAIVKVNPIYLIERINYMIYDEPNIQCICGITLFVNFDVYLFLYL